MADQYYDFMTPRFRLAFNNVLKADEDGKRSLCMLFENGETLDEIKALAAKLMTEKFGDKSKWPKGFKKPWREQSEKEGEYDGFEAGGLYMNASTYRDVQVVYSDGETPIIDAKDFYSGCYCYAKCQMKWFEAKDEKTGAVTNKGIRILFSHVMKDDDGEPLGFKEQDASEVFAPLAKKMNTKKSASSAFDDDDDAEDDPLS